MWGITVLRFCAVIYGSKCWASRCEMRWWVSDGKYGSTSFLGTFFPRCSPYELYTVTGRALNGRRYGAGCLLSAAGWRRPSPVSSALAGNKGRSSAGLFYLGTCEVQHNPHVMEHSTAGEAREQQCKSLTDEREAAQEERKRGKIGDLWSWRPDRQRFGKKGHSG
ncbi:uncharacterized protein LOC129206614 isoform X3 [Grus americana]|uniref:uncharacterized protein LOC129206614 isoform X3 n=1 Tax=Grus americana TaxID=9117 RepID=UPI0024077D04|nr:uncharacterized protein LOC129206614 isoform X3 [Grus americana]